MLKIAIIERLENEEKKIPFNIRYYLSSSFKQIFDELSVLLIPVVSEKYLEEIVNLCDGLVLTGSPNDIYPEYYGQEPIKGKEYKFDEYGFVQKIVKLFSKVHKPILGICAGIQEINVIFGGTLNQYIPNHDLKDQSTHVVNIANDSFLYEVYRKNRIDVNSYHKQSVKDLAPNFNVTAISEDGIIEGIEKDNIVAVQWHPEIIFDRNLFAKFITKFFNDFD